MPKSRKMRQSRKRGGSWFSDKIGLTTPQETDKIGLTTSQGTEPPTQSMTQRVDPTQEPSVLSRVTSFFSRTPNETNNSMVPRPVGGKRRRKTRRSSRFRKRR